MACRSVGFVGFVVEGFVAAHFFLSVNGAYLVSRLVVVGSIGRYL